jgi:hypothetical protein
MRTYLLGILLFISSIALAQRECASGEYLDIQKASTPSLNQQLLDVESFIRQHQNNIRDFRVNTDNAQPVYIIPVVVHILYNNASQNISEEQVRSQIDALNRDFRRTNNDASLTPDHFSLVAADVQIEFKLANVDPSGRVTNGIIRKPTSVTSFRTDDKIKFSHSGGSDAWDSKSYLNIWVGPMQSFIGYSSVPGSPSEKDGVVIATSAFGTINTAAPFNLGRTAVHEVGHWLGLKHIWGDQFCGDDLVHDTPNQGNFTPGCPSTFRTSCNNTATGDMYMNYMDYTNDACMNLFTRGQRDRMRSHFFTGGPRNSLLFSKGIGQAWNHTARPEEIQKPVQVKVFPNPVKHELVIQLGEEWHNKQVRITDIAGNILMTVQVTSGQQSINLSKLKPGMYIVCGERNGLLLREKFIRL